MAAKIPGHPLLSSDEKPIPLLGFGTAEYPLGSSPHTQEVIVHAIELGYRHFDTASVYCSENQLGKAIAEAVNLGLIKSRDDLFVTSKLWIADAHKDRVLPALRKSLENLGVDYLDLYLIHWPVSLAPRASPFPFYKVDIIPLDFEGVWEAMEECHRLGLVRNIGVSNFSTVKLEQLLRTAKIPPAVNQVELNPLWRQDKLREFCKGKGIHVSGYSPLGGGGTPWGNNRVWDCAALEEIARARGKTVAQVCLRWVIEHGASAIVKSYNKVRIRENLGISDWSLSEEDLMKIGRIPECRGCVGEEYLSETGPYKTLQEFWDE